MSGLRVQVLDRILEYVSEINKLIKKYLQGRYSRVWLVMIEAVASLASLWVISASGRLALIVESGSGAKKALVNVLVNDFLYLFKCDIK